MKRINIPVLDSVQSVVVATRVLRSIACLIVALAITAATTTVLAGPPVLINTRLPDALVDAAYRANFMVGSEPAPTPIAVSGPQSAIDAGHNRSGSAALNGTLSPLPADVFGSATSPARSPKASSDGLVLIRLLQGMSDAQLLNNIPIPLGAPNFSAAQIRQSINALCGADL